MIFYNILCWFFSFTNKFISVYSEWFGTKVLEFQYFYIAFGNFSRSEGSFEWENVSIFETFLWNVLAFETELKHTYIKNITFLLDIFQFPFRRNNKKFRLFFNLSITFWFFVRCVTTSWTNEADTEGRGTLPAGKEPNFPPFFWKNISTYKIKKNQFTT